jgi:hypothetical protein
MGDSGKPKYLIFDVESVADGELVSEVKYPGQDLTPSAAVEQFRQERQRENKTDFIPHTFQRPIAIVVAKVDKDFRLLDIRSLDEPQFRSHVMTRHFWTGWEKYAKPTLVTFNGRSFDLPLLELSAFRYGISIAKWFRWGERSLRNRFNQDSHLDLQELFTNFGACHFHGGLNLAANMLGKPGKMSIQGRDVQGYFDRGELQVISDYCRCDVLDTYFVFLRVMVVLGNLTLQEEHALIEGTKEWLEGEAAQCQAYADYLKCWGDWESPWEN